MRFTPALAVLITGLALYVSRGVLDQIDTAAGPIRVALLPPWQALGGFIAMAALCLLWLQRRGASRGTTTAVRPRLGLLVLPAIALVALLLPYLPFLADRFPPLQILAGPLRAVVWLAVVTQILWVLWQSRPFRVDWIQRLSAGQLALAIGLATALVSGVTAARFTGTVLFPAGDEPHYLIIAQSLWRDGDLTIENNHTRRDYSEYFASGLAPHYLTRGADGEIYSIHPVGMPVIMAPIYALGGYSAVVTAMVLIGAVAAALMWLAVVQATGAAGAATFAWAAIALTTPFLYNAFAVYPEIPAALATILAFTFAIDPRSATRDAGRWLVVGFACAALPWLSTKYAPMSAALVAIALARVVWPTLATAAPGSWAARAWAPGIWTRAAAIVVPYGVSLIAWFGFFYVIWGIPLPQAPYGALVQTDLRNLIFGAPGLFFDQEYGLLSYAPVYVLAATGLWAMWREGGDWRRRAIEVTVTFGALLGTVGAFRIWWGGSASPGRPLVSGLLLLALPIAMAFRSAPAGSARRAAHHLLLWLSVGVAGIIMLAQEGFLVANGRDGTSSLLEYLSPRWPAWSMAPSFIYHETLPALSHVAIWLVLAALAAFVLGRSRTEQPGMASLTAMTVCAIAVLGAAVIVPRLPTARAWPTVDLRARARMPLLDEFDTVMRPVGVEYSPLRMLPPADLVTRASLTAEPGLRTEPPPLRVLHNGRFSLPAGHYRVEIDWGGDRSGETLGLQIGRTGPVWRTWHVEPRTGQRWTAEFAVPVDMSFVGFRGTPELEGATRRITVVPLAVVDATRRPKLPTILAASHSGGTSLFYLDGNAFPEEDGFWVRGGRTTRVAVARENSDQRLTLRIHSGVIANRLDIATVGWTHTMALEPNLPEQVEIPWGTRSVLTLELRPADGFVPAEINPASKDVRALGAWIEVVQ